MTTTPVEEKQDVEHEAVDPHISHLICGHSDKREPGSVIYAMCGIRIRESADIEEPTPLTCEECAAYFVARGSLCTGKVFADTFCGICPQRHADLFGGV